MENLDLFGLPVVPEKRIINGQERTKSGSLVHNPMIKAYGITEGEKCKNCAHLVYKSYSKVYYKCKLRNNVDKCSPVSDHKVNWPACGKFLKSE